MHEVRKNEAESILLNLQPPALQGPEAEDRLEVNTPPAEASIDEDSPPEPIRGQRQITYSNKKSWWRRFLAGEPPDPRRAERETIPGLVAYFFTGGAPVAHEVQDISEDGLYVLTSERWYPNTLIRVTLSDQRDPLREVSLTLHARVARSGHDGVGLQFFLIGKNELERVNGAQEDDRTLLVTKDQFRDFIRRFKAIPREG